MSIQHITKYNGAELCEFCGVCQSEIHVKSRIGELTFCYNCFFGTNKNIVLPINIISQHFDHKCNDCEKSSIYKLENKTQTIYYCYHHISPTSPEIKSK